MNPPAPKIKFYPDGSEDCPLLEISGTDYLLSRELYFAIKKIRSSMAGSFWLHEVVGFEGCTDPKLYFEVSETNLGIQRSSDGKEFRCKLSRCKLSYDAWIDVEDSLAPFCYSTSSMTSYQWLYDSGGISLLYSPGGGW